MHNLVLILGVPVDSLTMSDALDQIESFIQIGRATGRSHQIATVNTDFIVNACREPDLMSLLQNASLAIPDGMPVVWAARSLGAPMAERVAGVDLVIQLAERAARRGYSLYLLGAAPQVAARAAELLQDRFPGLDICGVQSPSLRSIDDTDPGLLEAIRAARPDILLVAFGNPKQERWIARYGRLLQTPVMMGIGGTLDFISGNKKRAPRWMQAAGMEWIFRLAQEPGRLWRRYGRDILVFGAQFARQWLLMHRWRAQTTAARFEPPQRAGDHVVMSLGGDFSTANLPEFDRRLRQALELSPRLHIDLSHVASLDVTAIGEIVQISRLAQERGGRLALVNAPPSIRKSLSFLRIERLLDAEPATPGISLPATGPG